MKITYQLTPQDFREAFGPTKAKKVMTGLALLFIAALIPISLIASEAQRNELLRNIFPFLGVVGFWLTMMWFLPYWSAKKQFQGMPAAKSQ